MDFHEVIRETVARKVRGAQAAGHVNAVVAANIGEADATKVVHSNQRVRIVQRNGRTEVFEVDGKDYTTETGGAAEAPASPSET